MVLFVNRTILFYHLKKITQQDSQFKMWFFAQDSLVFEKQTHTHTKERENRVLTQKYTITPLKGHARKNLI